MFFSSIPLITVFRVFFNDENLTYYGEGDRITSVCLDARGIIVQDNVTVTVSSIATGTAIGKRNTSSYRFWTVHITIHPHLSRSKCRLFL